MSVRVLLQVKELTKTFGTKQIFHEAEVAIWEKQKIGVIGRNGAGKTTFFKMLMGLEEPDTGEILQMPILKLGYIPQNDPFEPSEIVIEFLQRYTQKPDWECAKVASQFQLKNEKLTSKIGDLSGGYQMRVKLTAVLLSEPNLLLLDEPTNYLDLSTLILLELFLKSFKGAFMVITHDREFIKKTCTSTMEVENGKLVFYPEPLEEYLTYKEEQNILAQKVNLNIEKKQKHLQTFADRFRAKKAKSAQSKLKQIARIEKDKITIDRPFSTVKMYIPSIENKQGPALVVKNLDIGYGTKKIASEISFEVERGKKVSILGDNGQGKSTLLKTLAGEISALNGLMEWKKGLKVAYYAQHVNQALNPEETVESYGRRMGRGNVGEEEIFRVLGNFLFKRTDWGKKVAVMSGGEKARLCLAGMFLTKADVYLLDEPTNHLDFETVEAMGEALGKFNGTVFVVSHDRTFVNLIANEILEVSFGKVKRVMGSFEQYVWQKEQEAESFGQAEVNTNISKSETLISKNTNFASSFLTAKEKSKKLYEMRKELQKLERKIENLKVIVATGENTKINQENLEKAENKWLEISEEIGKLG